MTYLGSKGPTGPKGAPGAMGIVGGQIDKAINHAAYQFGVAKEDILLGYRETPPQVEGYRVYIYYNGGAAEFWVRELGKWVNWSYMEH